MSDKEVVRKAIVDWDGNNILASVVQSTTDPTKYGLVICNPDWTPITPWGGWGTPWGVNTSVQYNDWWTFWGFWLYEKSDNSVGFGTTKTQLWEYISTWANYLTIWSVEDDISVDASIMYIDAGENNSTINGIVPLWEYWDHLRLFNQSIYTIRLANLQYTTSTYVFSFDDWLDCILYPNQWIHLIYDHNNTVWKNAAPLITTEAIQTKRPLKSVYGQTLEWWGDIDIYELLISKRNMGYYLPTPQATAYAGLRSTTNINQAWVAAGVAGWSLYATYATTTVVGNVAHMRWTSGGVFNVNWINGFEWNRKFQVMNSVSGSRFMVWLTNTFQLANPTNVEPDTVLNFIGVCKLSTSNNLHFITNDAAGVATTVDCWSSFPADNSVNCIYTITIAKVYNNSNIVLTLKRVEPDWTTISTTQTFNTDLPASSSISGHLHVTNNATASIMSLRDYGMFFNLNREL